MLALQRRLARRAAGVDDGGFTLVEVLVALIILALVFAATATAVIDAARNSVVARQHQTADALASQAVERVRALSNSSVVAGSVNAITADPAVTTTGGVSYYGNEALALNSGTAVTSGGTPLTTYPWPTVTTNGTKYTIKTFVTCKHTAFTGGGNGPACGSPTGSTDTIVYHLSVAVTWADRLGSATRQFTDSSYLYSASPTNTCQPNLPIAAPCQSVQYASATTGKVNITITPGDATTGGIQGVSLVQASLAAGDADSSLKVERVTTTNSDAEGGDAAWTAAGAADQFDGTSASAGASSDPDSGNTDGPTGSLSQASVAKSYTSSAGGNSLALTQDATSGSAVASSAAGSSPVCNDAGVGGTPAQQTNALPCGNGSVTMAGVHALAKATDSGAGLGQWSLLDLATSGTASSVWTGKMATGWNGHCTSPGLDGCVSAAAKRTLGTLSLGALPSALKSVNSHWDATNNYLVKLTGYADTATSEAGVTATSVAGPAATGTLSYWNGTGYTSTTALTSGSTIPLSFSVSSGSTTLTETGSITPGSVASNTAVGTCSSVCTANAAVHGLIVNITYTVVVGGVTIVSVALHADLGGVTTSATYQSSPSAS